MAIVTEISWDDMLDGKPLPEIPARKAWRDAVSEIAERAKATLPECNGRVDSAVKIVLAGDVELLPDGQAKVASQSNGTTQYLWLMTSASARTTPRHPLAGASIGLPLVWPSVRIRWPRPSWKPRQSHRTATRSTNQSQHISRVR
jgi:hypothetical protein